MKILKKRRTKQNIKKTKNKKTKTKTNKQQKPGGTFHPFSNKSANLKTR